MKHTCSYLVRGWCTWCHTDGYWPLWKKILLLHQLSVLSNVKEKHRWKLIQKGESVDVLVVWIRHLRGACRLFCSQVLSVAHCLSSKKGFHGPLRSPEGEKCCLSSTHQPLAWGQSSLPPTHRLHLVSPEKEISIFFQSMFNRHDNEILVKSLLE